MWGPRVETREDTERKGARETSPKSHQLQGGYGGGSAGPIHNYEETEQDGGAKQMGEEASLALVAG